MGGGGDWGAGPLPPLKYRHFHYYLIYKKIALWVVKNLCSLNLGGGDEISSKSHNYGERKVFQS